MTDLPSIISIARDAGFDIDLVDDVLEISPPRCPPSIEHVLHAHREAIVCELRRLRLRETERMRVGPFDGCGDMFFCYVDRCFGRRVARAKWAVYQVAGDFGADFVGYAKSEKKARKGDVYQTSEQASAAGVTSNP